MSNSLPAVVKPSAMPVTARVHHRLAYLDGDGKPVRYDSHSALVPATELEAVIFEVDGMNSIMPDAEIALTMAKNLIGAYPNERAKDPITYVNAMVTVLAKYPRDIGWKAIDELTLESEFPPTRAELNKACSALLGKRNDMKRAAQAQLVEHARRAAAQPPSGKLVRDMDDAEREEFFTKLREKYPGGMGIAQAVAGKGDDPERGTAPVNRVEG